MTESVLFRLLENIIPLLLAIIILVVIMYVLIKKIFSPFSAMGNFLWDKSTKFYNKIARERKAKLETQLRNIKIENSEWKTKYINNTNAILGIKDKLNDLSKIFTELNEIEIRIVVMEEKFDENNKQMDNLKTKDHRHIFSRLLINMKSRRMSKKNIHIEKAIQKNERDIIAIKETIKTMINELLDSLNALSDNKSS